MSEEVKKEGKSRREMMMRGSAFGLIGLGAAMGGGALFKYMMPVVSYGTPQKFLVPIAELPDVGDEVVYPDIGGVAPPFRKGSRGDLVDLHAPGLHGQPR